MKTNKLKVSEPLLTEAFDLMDFGVMIFEPVYDKQKVIADFKFIYANKVACTITSFSKKELLGNGLLQLMPGNKEDGLFDKYVEVFQSGNNIDFVQEYGKERLQPTVFRIIAKKMNDLLLIYFSDISVSTALNNSVRAQKDFFEMVYDFSKDAIFIVEVDENGTFRYSNTNISHQESTGIPLSAIQGKTPKELVGEDLGKKLANNYQRAAISEKGISYEEYLDLPSGRKYYSTTLNPVRNEEGRVTFLIGISRDISLRKKAEDDLVEVNKNLKVTATQKDKLFSVIAHDLKGPISTSQSLVDLLIESYSTLTKSQIEPYLKLIGDSLSQTRILMQDLLTWAVGQMGGYQTQWEQVFVNKELQEVIDTLQSQAKAKDINLVFDNKYNIIATSDANMLRIIVRNLLSNAIKFSHKGKSVKLILTSNENSFTIKVQDEGRGMDKKTLSKIFTTELTSEYGTEGEKGTGIGLQIVSDFVNRLNGNIEVHSVLDHGTTFTLTFDKTEKFNT